MNKKTIVIDFDDTLIATTPRLKQKLFNISTKSGISIEQARHAYLLTRNLFSIEKYIRQLKKNHPNKVSNIEMLKAFSKPKEYNYNGSEWFLKNLQHKGYNLILLTFGNKKLQQLKIDQSGLETYFNKIIFSLNIKKEKELLMLKKQYGEELLVLDDSDQALEAARKLNINTIKVRKSFKNKSYYSKVMRRIRKANS